MPDRNVMPIHPTDGPVDDWFELSYSTHQVLPRTLMQSMPIEWQERMVACLEELKDAFEHVDKPECYKVGAATEHAVSDLNDAQMKTLGITEDWYGGEEPPTPTRWRRAFAALRLVDPFEVVLNEWKAEHENSDGPTYYDADGNELDPHSYVFVPALDPLPYYRHSYIEPHQPEAVSRG